MLLDLSSIGYFMLTILNLTAYTLTIRLKTISKCYYKEKKHLELLKQK